MNKDTTIEEAKQHILNLIPKAKSGEEVKLLTAAYGDMLNAEYQDLNLRGYRTPTGEGECVTPEQADFIKQEYRKI